MKKKIEDLIRDGNFVAAEKLLRQIKLKNIPRQDILAYANLANRCGQIKLSVKILTPIILSDKPGAQPPSSEEKAQYASGLRKLGAVSAAQEILRAIDPAQCPKAALELAFCYFNQWKYESAIPLLERYVAGLARESYERSVGLINLLSAYIFERRLGDAAAVIAELQKQIETRPLLYGGFLELSAQLEIARGEWDTALSLLEHATKLLKNAERSVPRLLIEKWKAVARALKSGGVSPELQAIKQEALTIRHWETVRDCDFHLASLAGDKTALIQLYFFTPYDGFRKKIVEALGRDVLIPQVWHWGKSGGTVLNPLRGSLSDGRAQLPVGQAVHRFLILLCSDLYRPVTLVCAFSKLFPEEYFNPVSSPNRIHQVVRRFRKWVEKNSLPLELQEIDGTYKLILTGAMSVAIPREPLPLDAKELEFIWLRELFNLEQFTAKDVIEATGLSRSSAHRLLQWAVQEKKVQVSGNTKGARYKMAV